MNGNFGGVTRFNDIIFKLGKMNCKNIFLLLFFNGLFYFGVCQNNINEPPMIQTNAFKGMFVYHDGNGNKYTLLRNILEYFPIKKAESSSGIYDGGNAFKKTLNAAQYQKLFNLFNKLITDKTCHTKQNIKPNCSIQFLEEEGNEEFIIKANNKTNKQALIFLSKLNK